MKEIKRWIGTFVLSLLFYQSWAQQPEMADIMRSDGKIYVVIGVVALIFLVLFSYLVYLDLKVRRIENDKKAE